MIYAYTRSVSLRKVDDAAPASNDQVGKARKWRADRKVCPRVTNDFMTLGISVGGLFLLREDFSKN